MMRSLNFSDADSYAEGSVNRTAWTGGSGWSPIGSCTTTVNGFCDAYASYAGVFEGNHHSLFGLFISTDSHVNGLGLFTAMNGTVRNPHLSDAEVSGVGNNVGMLVGYGRNARFENISVSGTISNSFGYNTGTLGGNLGGATLVRTAVKNSDVFGLHGVVGGLVGEAIDSSMSLSSVRNTSVSGGVSIGGMVGYVNNVWLEHSSVSACMIS